LEMQIIAEKCTGCGVCVETCPNSALQLVNGLAILEQAACTQCQACIDACPEGAISAVEVSIVVAEPVPVQPARASQAVITKPVPIEAKPWLLSLLAFAGQEILPRLADALIGALDRRLALAQPVKTQISTPSEQAERAITPDRNGGYRRRYRAGSGRRHRKGRGQGIGKRNGFRNSKERR
jgi:NAD-dependent dihydropyrimidine dehydrogenase PreA subunit